ncbi:hypothetical protein HK102_001541, partial [Quaeritorhiza haematococci]
MDSPLIAEDIDSLAAASLGFVNPHHGVESITLPYNSAVENNSSCISLREALDALKMFEFTVDSAPFHENAPEESLEVRGTCGVGSLRANTTNELPPLTTTWANGACDSGVDLLTPNSPTPSSWSASSSSGWSSGRSSPTKAEARVHQYEQVGDRKEDQHRDCESSHNLYLQRQNLFHQKYHRTPSSKIPTSPKTPTTKRGRHNPSQTTTPINNQYKSPSHVSASSAALVASVVSPQTKDLLSTFVAQNPELQDVKVSIEDLVNLVVQLDQSVQSDTTPRAEISESPLSPTSPTPVTSTKRDLTSLHLPRTSPIISTTNSVSKAAAARKRRLLMMHNNTESTESEKIAGDESDSDPLPPMSPGHSEDENSSSYSDSEVGEEDGNSDSGSCGRLSPVARCRGGNGDDDEASDNKDNGQFWNVFGTSWFQDAVLPSKSSVATTKTRKQHRKQELSPRGRPKPADSDIDKDLRHHRRRLPRNHHNRERDQHQMQQMRDAMQHDEVLTKMQALLDEREAVIAQLKKESQGLKGEVRVLIGQVDTAVKVNQSLEASIDSMRQRQLFYKQEMEVARAGEKRCLALLQEKESELQNVMTSLECAQQKARMLDGDLKSAHALIATLASEKQALQQCEAEFLELLETHPHSRQHDENGYGGDGHDEEKMPSEAENLSGHLPHQDSEEENEKEWLASVFELDRAATAMSLFDEIENAGRRDVKMRDYRFEGEEVVAESEALESDQAVMCLVDEIMPETTLAVENEMSCRFGTVLDLEPGAESAMDLAVQPSQLEHQECEAEIEPQSQTNIRKTEEKSVEHDSASQSLFASCVPADEKDMPRAGEERDVEYEADVEDCDDDDSSRPMDEIEENDNDDGSTAV